MNKEVGKSTAGDRLKRAHRGVVVNGDISLKDFARGMIKTHDALEQDAKDWFASKAGSGNLNRDKKTVDRITAEKIAKKAARSKKK